MPTYDVTVTKTMTFRVRDIPTEDMARSIALMKADGTLGSPRLDALTEFKFKALEIASCKPVAEEEAPRA